MIEEFVAWCASSEALANVRSRARSDSFGHDESGTVKYLPGAGNLIPTEAGTKKILVGNVFDLYESKGEIVGGI
jgi:hypothetical protein